MNEVLIGQILHSFGHLQTHGEQLQLDFFDLNGIKPSRHITISCWYYIYIPMRQLLDALHRVSSTELYTFRECVLVFTISVGP